MSTTTTQKHTAGPWTVMRFDGGASWGVMAEDRVIGTMHGGRTGEPNARLIAAAPDLLKALEWLHRVHHSTSDHVYGTDIYETTDLYRAVEGALAKATGVQS